MSRFSCYDEEGIPWDLWETIVSRAFSGRRGQTALADMEAALVALPEPKLIEGHLVVNGGVCAVGALVAHKRAQDEGIDIQAVIDLMSSGVTCFCGHSPGVHSEGACAGRKTAFGTGEVSACPCSGYDPDTPYAEETVSAGRKIGLTHTVAYHLAYLNDESFRKSTPEERYDQILTWVRRAQGKMVTA